MIWAGAIELYSLAKHVVDRPRPPMHLWLTSASSSAFPSGHATQSLSTFAALALVSAAVAPIARRPGLALAAVVAAGVGWSRVYLGVHWATDVLAGWLAAACWVALVARCGAYSAYARGITVTDDALDPLDQEVDHVRGGADGRLLIEYGDYECPFSRQAYREIQRLEQELGDAMRFAFRHFPLTEIHPHAAAAAAAAEAAAVQGRFWDMHDHLYHHQHALEDDDLLRYAADLGLDVERFDADRGAEAVLERVIRDFRSGMETGEVRGTPTLFIDGAVHLGAYDLDTLREAMTS